MNHSLPCPTFVLDHAQKSDLGMRRSNNQDALVSIVAEDAEKWLKRGHLFIVADGMGAHAAGELASQLAVENVPHTYFKLCDLYPPAALRQAIRQANKLINEKGRSSAGFHGMGTTCSCLVLLPQGALVAHIGDSRVYRQRGEMIEQLTFDHSLVWEMAAAGHMSEDEVPAYIPKNVITRSLGPHEKLNIDIEGPYDAQAGDVFLLCSDGLSGQISDDELGAILVCLSPEDAVQTFVDLANLRGGPDNISVSAVRVVGELAPKVAFEQEVPKSTPGNHRNWLAAGAWAVTAGCLAILVYSLVAMRPEGIIISLIGMGVSAAVASRWQGKSKKEQFPTGSIGGPYGNGPYRKAMCKPNREIVDSLADLSKQLREVETNGSLSVDWGPLDELGAEAAAAADKGDYRAAVELYCQGIRNVMKDIRTQQMIIQEGTTPRVDQS